MWYNSYPDRLLGNMVCSIGRIDTVTAGASLMLATVFMTTTVGTGELRLRVLSSVTLQIWREFEAHFCHWMTLD